MFDYKCVWKMLHFGYHGVTLLSPFTNLSAESVLKTLYLKLANNLQCKPYFVVKYDHNIFTYSNLNVASNVPKVVYVFSLK